MGETCYDDGSAFCDSFHPLARVNGIVHITMMGLRESNKVNRGEIAVVPLRQHCCEEWHGEIFGWRYDGV